MKVDDSSPLGRHGPHVTYQTRYGKVRARISVPFNPQSDGQIAARSLFSEMTQLWPTITQKQRDGWTEAAKPDRSGFQLFVQVNVNRRLTGHEWAADAPPKTAPGPMPKVELLILPLAGKLRILFHCSSPWPTTVMLKASPPMSCGVSKCQIRRYLGVAGPVADGQVDFTEAYENVFGAILAGHKIFVWLTPVHNGHPGMEEDYFALTTAETERAVPEVFPGI